MTQTPLPAEIREKVTFNDAGLLPAIAQDAASGEVLMLAWMNAEALASTLSSGRATYWSRSRGELWRKGETSGHVQQVRQVSLDCDGDTVLLTVDQTGPACHTGARTCFTGREVVREGGHDDKT
ncbi:phosphoribosyl-AMP cyclohydrolase [Nesterenkonia sp. HG001]|uniref:phosphoribosyl-AMP cyclohydrolase n=1 Tax=Nesterenkonia sp. HG001 TaxID=2983207 RepID=UPI002AC69D26|nr:phosphoribosyl-AMP cyclohydrolase [Nesterenkonia sp. HG001]MDZ5075951.1 phosphoribosyl-AMP cyclohydrolase [Nesterenkonia sp. HG001]